MPPAVFLKKFIFVLALAACGCICAQPAYSFNIETKSEQCEKGSASLIITDTIVNDSIRVTWSTGQKDVATIAELEGGDYTVEVVTKYHKDTVWVTKDTLLSFKVEKERCPLVLNKYFSPNDDGYNDVFTIGFIERYPNFELSVYNKWGQRVHHQKKTYTPWDGKWAGVDLPDGTYYYVIFYEAGNSKDLVKGDVTILR